MKTSTSQMEVRTWLPIFSGFYGTIWESDNDEEMELDNINLERSRKGLTPVAHQDLEFDYEAYQKDVVRYVTNYISVYLIDEGFICGFNFEKLNQPHEYNFANDSIDVTFYLNQTNKENIRLLLNEHSDAFAEYITEKYTSYDGFISSYSNNSQEWIAHLDDALTNGHQLGSILEFIIRTKEGEDIEHKIYEEAQGNGVRITSCNYDRLVPQD